jgi:hypothetical protein
VDGNGHIPFGKALISFFVLHLRKKLIRLANGLPLDAYFMQNEFVVGMRMMAQNGGIELR